MCLYFQTVAYRGRPVEVVVTGAFFHRQDLRDKWDKIKYLTQCPCENIGQNYEQDKAGHKTWRTFCLQTCHIYFQGFLFNLKCLEIQYFHLFCQNNLLVAQMFGFIRWYALQQIICFTQIKITGWGQTFWLYFTCTWETTNLVGNYRLIGNFNSDDVCWFLKAQFPLEPKQ